jgi:predicted ester cyclase
MTLPSPVAEFYEELWNRRDRSRIDRILHPDVSLRGSLGGERHGHGEYWRHVEEVTGPLADYRCDEITSVCDDRRVFARMRFGGRHIGEFRGFAPTGEMVEWQGAALFEIDSSLIISVWVLGDLTALDALLDRQAREAVERSGTRGRTSDLRS